MRERKWPLERHPRFRVGERVVMTRHGLRQGLNGRSGKWGTVVAWSPEYAKRLSVIVLRDGRKRPDRYAVIFWRHKRRTDR